jgi:hypothetical protein
MLVPTYKTMWCHNSEHHNPIFNTMKTSNFKGYSSTSHTNELVALSTTYYTFIRKVLSLAGTPFILIEVFHCLIQFLQENSGIVP